MGNESPDTRRRVNRLRLAVRGCLVAALAACIVCLIVFLVYFAVALRIPNDAPRARMYRAETDLTAMAKAVDTYFNTHGAYPESGSEGLRRATAHLSSSADYFPTGPPLDPWYRPYVYVRHTDYRKPGSWALHVPEGFHAPNTYQLYSKGADGVAGLDDEAQRRDNICHWDRAKSWRPLYKTRTATKEEDD